MSEPNFNKPAGRVSSSDEKPSPSLIASQVPSPATLLPQSVNNATPTSPPRQAFFQSGSAGSFSRFPTPDKLAMGFTPSPVQQSNLSPTGLLLPPISPSGPILAADSSLLRSTSSQTIQSDSSSSSSLNTSSSASRLSDIDKSDLPSTEQKQPSEHVAKRSGSKSRGGLSRSDIRESLLSFPSPPTSPRLFTFGRAAGTVLSASNAREAASLSGRNAPTSDILHAGIVQEEDDLQSSIDELLAGTGAGVNSLLPSPLNFPVSSSSSASMSPGALPSAHAPRSLASASLPPNMALPPLPPISKLSLEQGDSPSQETPGSGDVSLAASYIRPILPLRTPQMTAAPVFENKPVGLEPDSSSSQLAASESATIPSKASHSPSTAPPRPLRPSKSTESLLASRTHQMTSTSKTAMPTPVSHTDTPKQSRRRRASLSIKIPKMFTKTRKAEEDLLPQSAISQNSLQIPQSRFSPDSDGPVSYPARKT